MSEDKIRFIVVGCGRFGGRRARLIKANPEAELLCLVDSNKELATKLGKELNCEFSTDYMQTLDKKENDVDVVLIATPNAFHAQQAIEAMNRKKIVFCEKPLAKNPLEAMQMFEASKKNNVVLKTGSNLRFFPSVLKANELLKQGAIGDLIHFRGWIGNDGEQLNYWFNDFETTGGGTLLDNGAHLLDLSRMFLGEVEECVGYTQLAHWPHKTKSEDNAYGLFKFKGNKFAFVQASWTEWLSGYMYGELNGRNGHIILDNRTNGNKLTIFNKRETPQVFDFSCLPPQSPLLPLPSYAHEISDFIRAIKEKREPRPNGFDGMRAVQMAYAIYESARTGNAVKIPEDWLPSKDVHKYRDKH
jgi:predicted dehydrogenase